MHCQICTFPQAQSHNLCFLEILTRRGTVLCLVFLGASKDCTNSLPLRLRLLIVLSVSNGGTRDWPLSVGLDVGTTASNERTQLQIYLAPAVLRAASM